MRRNEFVCDANTGIEIRGNRAYGQVNAGDSWYDDGRIERLPMSYDDAERWVSDALRFVAGPTQQRVIRALTEAR